MGTDTIKQPTHAQNRKNAAIRCKKRVMWLLHWDELRYCMFKYEEGLLYLRIYLKGDVHAIGIIERSPVFWGWWKNHWTIREEEYINHTDELSKMAVRMRVKAYRALHDAHMLAAEISPTAQGMGDSYATMMGMLFTEAKQQTNA